MPGYYPLEETTPPDEIFKDLLNKVKLYDKDKNHIAKLKKAYTTASEAHIKQKRASGAPYIIHPLESARILADLRLDIPTITAAILHDAIEDTELTYEDIKEKFGKTIANLVDGVTKLTAISASKGKSQLNHNKSKADGQAENLRKIFLAMARDIRVILIKVADRLHNLKTLKALPEKKQKSIAKETIEIFAPITSRLGMWEFKWQLEDMAFYYLEPKIYKNLVKQVAQKRKEREELIEKVKLDIEKSLKELNLKNVHIEGRPKHLYSIYRKMKDKNLDLDEIYDLLAVRVIVDDVGQCYQVLGIVHNLWLPFQGRFKDYIATPKSNNYKSLHTTIYGPGSQPIEIQIRTWEMHKVNEYGIAAHWAYKQGSAKGIKLDMFSEIYPWIRRILDWQDESKDAKEYIDNLKLDLLESEVFVFTPKGDVIDLTAGSTPIDFAYRIHTEVGHRCIGAKVNSKIVPLEYNLKNADIIEILSSKHGTPSLDWLKIARTNHAKNKIRQWFKKERREENIVRGRELVLQEIKRHRIEISLNNEEIFGKIATRYNFQSTEDLFASVGYGETSPITVINRVIEYLPTEDKHRQPFKPPEESEETKKRKEKRKRKAKSPISIKGVGNLMVRFGKCCSPVYGDNVIGFISMGKGISVHRKNCPNYPSLAQTPERLIEVEWVEQPPSTTYNVELQIDGYDRAGLLSEVMIATNDLNFFVKSAKAWSRNSQAIIKISVEVPSKTALDGLIKKLKTVKDVKKVYRITHQRKMK